MAELSISDQVLPVNAVRGRISSAKNALITAERFVATETDFAGERIGQVYVLYEKKLAATGALDFDDLIARSVRLLSGDPAVLAEERRRRASPPDRRVPGHELVPGRARPALRRGRRLAVRGGRRGPGDLPLARRGGRAHPALRHRLSGRAHRRPRGQLPLDGEDPGGGGGAGGPQPAAPREAPARRPRRRRARQALALRGGPRGDRGGRPRDRRVRPRAGRHRHPLPHQRAVAAVRRRARPAAHPVRRRGRHEVLRARRGQGRPGVPAAGRAPRGRPRLPARRQRAGARHRRRHARPARRRGPRERPVLVGGRRRARRG